MVRELALAPGQIGSAQGPAARTGGLETVSTSTLLSLLYCATAQQLACWAPSLRWLMALAERHQGAHGDSKATANTSDGRCGDLPRVLLYASLFDCAQRANTERSSASGNTDLPSSHRWPLLPGAHLHGHNKEGCNHRRLRSPQQHLRPTPSDAGAVPTVAGWKRVAIRCCDGRERCPTRICTRPLSLGHPALVAAGAQRAQHMLHCTAAKHPALHNQWP